MDLRSGVERVVVLMEHTSKKRRAQDLKQCSLPSDRSRIRRPGIFSFTSLAVDIGPTA